MVDKEKTKSQLIDELEVLRQKVADFEQRQTDHKNGTHSANWVSVEKLRVITENAPLIIFEIDQTGKILYMNRAPVGISLDQVIGQCMYDFMNPAYHDTVKDKVLSVFKTDQPTQYETAGIGPYGEEAFYLSHIAPLQDESGRISTAIIVTHDITNMKEAEHALRENEIQFRTIAENYPRSFLLIIEKDFTIGYSAGQELKQQNLDPQQFVGLTLVQVFGEHEPFIREQYEQTFQGDECSFDLFVNEQYQRCHTVPLISEDGSIRQILAVVENNTERVLARKELEVSEEKFSKAFHNNTSLMAISSMGTGIIEEVNDTLLTLMGYSREEVIGKNHLDLGLLSPDTLEQLIQEMQPDGQVRELQLEFRKKNGQEVYCIYNGETISIAGESKLLSVAQDITEKVKAEQALVERKRYIDTLHENMQDEICVITSSYQISEVNDAFLSHIGLKRQDVIGNQCHKVIFGYDEPCPPHSTPCRCGDVFKTGQSQSYLHDDPDNASGRMFVDYQFIPLKNSQGEVMAVIQAARNVTEFFYWQGAFRDSEVRLQSIVRAAPVGIGLIDENRNLVWMNHTLCVMTGYSSSELEGRNSRVLFLTNDDFEKVGREELDQIVKNGTGTIETQFQCKDGSIIDVLLCSTPLDSHDWSQGVTVTVMDITGRKRSEQALLESEEKYRSLFEHMQNGLALHEMVYDEAGNPIDYKFLTVNKAFEEQTNLSEESIIGKRVSQVLPGIENDPFDWIGKYGQVVSTGESIFFENYAEPLDRWYSVVAYRPRKGQFATVFQEITERKQAEQEIKRLHDFNQGIVQGVAEALLMEDAQGNITFCNPAASVLLGYPPEELCTFNWSDIVSVSEFDSIRKIILNRPEDVVDQYETIIVSADGREIPVIVNVRILYDGDKFDGALSAITDISETKKAAQALEQLADQLMLLNDVSQSIVMTLDLKHLLEQITFLVHNTFGYHHVAIYSIDNEKKEVVCESLTGHFDNLFPELHRIPFGTGVIGWVAQSKKTLHSNDVEVNPHYKNYYPGQIQVKSELAVPIIIGEEILGVLDIHGPERNAFDENDVLVIETLADQIAVAMRNTRLLEQIRIGRQRMARLSHRLVEAQEKERRRIAQELHDEIGQTLTALSISLDGITAFEMGDLARNKIKDLLSQTQELTAQVHRLSLGLRPSVLDDLGLEPAIASMCNRISSQAHVEIALSHSGISGKRFLPDLEINLYRIIQEALTNIVRHSGAKKASVKVWVEAGNLMLEIMDEGQGFDLHSALDQRNSMGVMGMAERAELVGGFLSIDTAPGQGTFIFARLPLDQKRLERRESDRNRN